MRHVFKLLSLLAVLIVAQQGAVVHELSHVFRANAELKVDSRAAAADTTCAQCPAFAQVATPACSHSFHIPILVRVAAQLSTELEIAAIDAAVPQPRSRGPPSLS
jgi:hypothetical protein